jgi:uncharacterized protein involved in exopolysaccharide biosynthesis
MEANKEEYYSLQDIINFIRQLGNYLLRKWWLLLLCTGIFILLGIAYYNFFQKPKYEAVCTFILEEKQSGIGNLGGLASQFGFDIGSLGSGESIFAGDNILDILKSKNIIQNVLLSKIDSNNSSKSIRLADFFLEFSGWKKRWSENKDLQNFSFANYTNEESSLQQDSVLNLIYDNLLKHSLTTERLNKKGSIIKITFTSVNTNFAKLMTERIVEASKIFYITIKTNTLQQNVNRLERKSDSLLALLNYKSYEVASAAVLDANPAIKSANVPSELKSRDKTILSALYSEMVKNLELSRISLSQQTPVIQILDSPTLPLADKSKTLLFLVLTSTLAGLLVTAIVLALRFLAATHKRNRSIAIQTS